MSYKNNNKSLSTAKCNSKPAVETTNDIFSIFCATSSIRGMQKINKAQTPFLKVLWVGFVFTTTLMLLVTIVLLVKEYLGYYTAWHTSTKLEDESLFPAITMCSHNPFSLTAKEIWSKNLIKSPNQFTNRLINLSLVNLNGDGSRIFDTIVLQDGVQNYYTTLLLNETIHLSHKEEFFKFCVVDLQHSKLISRNCTEDFSETVSVKMFSHRNFFNCWTVEPKKSKTGTYNEISSLIVVASLIPSNSIPELNDAFVMDILERGEGLKIVLHETGTYPDIDKDGFNIQPGKLNEIAYEPIKWTFLSTPIKICKDDQQEIRDLDLVFNYTFSQCVDAALQKYLLNKCKCLSSLWPRPITPNEKYPYCFNIWRGSFEEISERINCTSKFMDTMKAQKESLQMNECFPRCNFFSYSTTLSITKWLPSIQKLERVNKVQEEVEMLVKKREDEIIQNNYRQYITTKYQNNQHSLDNDSLNEDRFTYIKLIRKNKNTTIKTEKLVLDVAILLSRIGGLCSLFIGLTVAFFIELIEFVYLLVQMKESQNVMCEKVEIKTNVKCLTTELQWEFQKINTDSTRLKNQIKDFQSKNVEIFIDNSLHNFDLETKFEEANDNDVLIWHQGDANNSTHERTDENSYPQTIISEL